MSEGQVMQLARETRSSIEVTRNARGDYQWVIKCYFESGAQGPALADIEEIDVVLRATYLPEPTEVAP